MQNIYAFYRFLLLGCNGRQDKEYEADCVCWLAMLHRKHDVLTDLKFLFKRITYEQTLSKRFIELTFWVKKFFLYWSDIIFLL